MHLLANGACVPMETEMRPGQTSDTLGFDPAMADKMPTPIILLDERGHDADSIRTPMNKRDALSVIPCADHERSALPSTGPCTVVATLSNGASTS